MKNKKNPLFHMAFIRLR